MKTKLLITADDFTGALDTGVQLAKKGISTRVYLDASDVSFSGEEVVVVSTNSRHINKEEAYEKVKYVVELGKDSGVEYFYKKTDSTLRGNIGSELEAMLTGTKTDTLHFIPAFPKMKRTTINGIQYYDGVEVSKSIFGKDPFDPVHESNIDKLIKSQSTFKVSLESEYSKVGRDGRIVVYDAKTDEDLLSLAIKLKDSGAKVFAGCAGFADFLSEIIDFNKTIITDRKLLRNLFVISGSLNPITLKQFEYAQKNSFNILTMKNEDKINPSFVGSNSYIELRKEIKEILMRNTPVGIRSVERLSSFVNESENHSTTNKEIVANNIGSLAADILRDNEVNVFIIGGDILYATLKTIMISSVIPIGEPFKGVVEFEVEIDGKRESVFSKAGSFGNESIIVDMYEYISNERKVSLELLKGDKNEPR